MSQDPRQDNMHDELVAGLASAAPEVPEMTAIQREQAWAAVLAEVQGAAGAAATAQNETTSSEPRARRLFPSGVLGRSVLALAACSAAIAVGVSVSHTGGGTTLSASQTAAPAQQPNAKLIATPTLDARQQDSLSQQPSVLSAKPESKRRVEPDKVGSELQAGVCRPASPLVESCFYDTSYRALVPLDVPAEGDEPLPTVSVDEPRMDSAVSGVAQWTATAWFANQSSRTISFDQVPSLAVLPAHAVNIDEQCTQRSQEWTVNGEVVPEVRGLASGENAYLTVTAVCTAGAESSVPDVRVQWGSSSLLAALFQVFQVP